MKAVSKLCALLCLAALCSSVALAEDPKGKPAMSEADMAKAMEMCVKMGTPGAEHAALAKMAGEWTCTNKFWMDPSQPPMETTSNCTDKVILDGRVVHSEMTGDMMGMPFHGYGMTGYDNFRKEYWMTWNDNMMTGIITAVGKASADGKTITYTGKMDDIMTNRKDTPVKWVVKITDDNNYVMESWSEAGTPKEFKSMEIAYKRK